MVRIHGEHHVDPEDKERARRVWLAELEEQRKEHMKAKKLEEQQRKEAQLVYTSLFEAPWRAATRKDDGDEERRQAAEGGRGRRRTFSENPSQSPPTNTNINPLPQIDRQVLSQKAKAAHAAPAVEYGDFFWSNRRTGGGGAPMRDVRGNVVTSRKRMDSSEMQERDPAFDKPPIRNETPHQQGRPETKPGTPLPDDGFRRRKGFFNEDRNAQDLDRKQMEAAEWRKALEAQVREKKDRDEKEKHERREDSGVWQRSESRTTNPITDRSDSRNDHKGGSLYPKSESCTGQKEVTSYPKSDSRVGQKEVTSYPKIETPKAQSRNFSSRLPQARKEERKPILTPLQTKSQISSLERPNQAIRRKEVSSLKPLAGVYLKEAPEKRATVPSFPEKPPLDQPIRTNAISSNELQFAVQRASVQNFGDRAEEFNNEDSYDERRLKTADVSPTRKVKNILNNVKRTQAKEASLGFQGHIDINTDGRKSKNEDMPLGVVKGGKKKPTAASKLRLPGGKAVHPRETSLKEALQTSGPLTSIVVSKRKTEASHHSSKSTISLKDHSQQPISEESDTRPNRFANRISTRGEDSILAHPSDLNDRIRHQRHERVLSNISEATPAAGLPSGRQKQDDSVSALLDESTSRDIPPRRERMRSNLSDVPAGLPSGRPQVPSHSRNNSVTSRPPWAIDDDGSRYDPIPPPKEYSDENIRVRKGRKFRVAEDAEDILRRDALDTLRSFSGLLDEEKRRVELVYPPRR